MLIDAHSHLDAYDELGPSALESALSEIEAGGIFTISNSMDQDSYRRNREIAAKSKLILPVFGIHPWNAYHYSERLEDFAPEMSESPIYGEIGLDHFFVRDAGRYPAQEEVFRFFLEAARAQNKPVIIHTKGAESETLKVCAEYAPGTVVVHWYSGPVSVFREMAARGWYFTVGFEVKRSKHIQAIAREVRFDRLLTETDNPGGPKSVTGLPGMPLMIRDVVSAVANLRGISEQELEEAVQSNIIQLFGNSSYQFPVPGD